MAKVEKWPKLLPPLTAEQRAISDDFMQYWHEILPHRYGIIEKFNHGYVATNVKPGFVKTLEIGAGLGEHLNYEKLTAEQLANYHVVDVRPNMLEKLREAWPTVQAQVADCQTRLDFPDEYFDRIIAIHVLEHLPNLPAAIRELHRLCNKKRGQFQVVIPCEGGFAYTIARRISSQRIFEQRYKQSFRWFYTREHINLPGEITEELKRYFQIQKRSWFPLPGLGEWGNLCIGMNLTPLAV